MSSDSPAVIIFDDQGNPVSITLDGVIYRLQVEARIVSDQDPLHVIVDSISSDGLTDAELRASAVPVSVSSLPLPSGASTETTLALIKAKTDNIDVALSTRAVTGLTDAQLRATPVPVSGTVTTGGLTDIQLRATPVDVLGPLTDTQLRAAPVVISGAVTNTILSVVGSGTEATAQRVTIATDSTGVLSVDDNGSSLTVDGTVAATQSGTWTVQPGNTANTTPWLATVSQGGNAATVSAGGALKVDGSAVTQPVSGTITANIGTTGGLALDATLTGGTQTTKITDGSNTATIRNLAANDALNVSIVDGAGDQITSFDGGTQYTEDIASASDPVGNQIIARRRDSLSSETTTDGDNTAVNSTAKGELYVKHVDAVPVTDNAGSLTIDNAILSVIGGGTEATAQRVTIATDSTGVLSIDDNGGSITVDGTFWQATQPVSGTITANIGTTNGLALDATVAKLTIAQSTALDSNTLAMVGGSVTTAAPTYVTGNINPLSLTTTGALRTDGSDTTQPISAISLPLPSLAATSTLQATGNTSLSSIDGKLPTALVGGRLDENIGAWLGSTAPTVGTKTSVNSIPVVVASDQVVIPVSGPLTDTQLRATAVPVSTTQLPAALVGGRLDENIGAWLGSTAPTVGQKTAVNSLPVIIASDQTPGADRTASGVINTTEIVSINTQGCGTCVIELSDGWTGVIIFEATVDGVNWFSISVYNAMTGLFETSETVPPVGGSVLYSACAGFLQVRVNGNTGVTIGSATVRLSASQGGSSFNCGYASEETQTTNKYYLQNIDSYLSYITANQLPATLGQKTAPNSLSTTRSSTEDGQQTTAKSLSIVGPNNSVLETSGTGKVTFSAGGGYCVSGYQTAIVAAAKAANTMLMSMRNGNGSNLIYITRLSLIYSVVTAFGAAAVPGALVWQRFTAQTPTGGTQRTPARKNLATGGATNITDVRDSNAALTGTAPTFGDILGTAIMPAFTVSGSYFSWEWDCDANGGLPIVLAANDGIALRTGTAAFAATGTWLYSYIIDWFERP